MRVGVCVCVCVCVVGVAVGTREVYPGIRISLMFFLKFSNNVYLMM